MTSNSKFLTIEEVRAISRAPLSTVREWIADGRLRSVKPGRRRLVREDWLEAFMLGAAVAK